MLDEKMLEAALEADAAEVSPGPELWAKIRRETMKEEGMRMRSRSRRKMGRQLEVLAACVLFAVLLGFAALRGGRVAPPPGPAGEDGPSFELISREVAIATASKYAEAGNLEVRRAELQHYGVNGQETTVWRVEFQTKELKQLVSIYFLDALSGQVVGSELIQQSQGGVGGGQAGLQSYRPVKLSLYDYPGVERDLVANPDEAVAAGVRALGGPVDYGSPKISPTPGYGLTLVGPDGREVVLRYVGDGNWGSEAGYVEGKALAEAVAAALPIPAREPGDLEYLFGATELTVPVELQQRISPAEAWQKRRQVVVRVLRELGKLQADGTPVPTDPPMRFDFVVQGRTETVEIWDHWFRYGGRVYYYEHILQTIGTNMNAG